MKIIIKIISNNNISLLFFLPHCYLIFFLSIFASFGCSSEVLKGSGILERHAIIVDKEGKPYLPIEKSECPNDSTFSCEDTRHWYLQEDETNLPTTYEEYLKKLISSVKEHFGEKKKNLLLFIHGGLNEQTSSNERATQLAEQIIKDPENDFYPVFVNWNTGLFSSYGEHLISVRQGKRARWGWTISPVFFATDIGRSLIRAPIVWGSLISNDLISTPSNKDNWFYNFWELAKDERNANRIAEALKNEPEGKSFPFWLGPQASYTWGDWVLGPPITVITYPIKLLLAPWIDALGKSAWENMVRRADLLFHTEKNYKGEFTSTNTDNGNTEPETSGPTEFEGRIKVCQSLIHQQQGVIHTKPNGALSVFLQNLTKEIIANYSDWSITLVGHSMGTIIVNHVLRDFGACLPIDNIVLMAAASTINSYKDSVYPFLAMRQIENENHGSSVPTVYHLMLHELAETSETNFWNLPPTGSLLVWIDNFLSTPNTPMDYTSGRFINLMLSLYTTPSEIRPHISIKRFPGGGSGLGGTIEGIPSNHSDFSERFRFWIKDCWKVPNGKNDDEKFQNEKNKKCFF